VLGRRHRVVLHLPFRSARPEQEHHQQPCSNAEHKGTAADADETAGVRDGEQRRAGDVCRCDAELVGRRPVVTLGLERPIRPDRFHSVDDQHSRRRITLGDAVDDDLPDLGMWIGPRDHEITEVVGRFHRVTLDDDQAGAAAERRRPEGDERRGEQQQRESVEQVASEMALAVCVRVDVSVCGHGAVGEVTRMLVKRTVPPPDQ
jgi:hypothetical protein